MLRSRFKNLILLALFSSSTAVMAAECDASNADLCHQINDEMNRATEASTNRRTGSRPNNYDKALQALGRVGIFPFQSYTQAVEKKDIASMRELVFQEWIRNFQGGMTWLPLSWGYGHYPLYHYSNYMPKFESAVSSLPYPLTDENLLLVYLFSTSVPHANTSSYAVTVRELAKTILNHDSGFYELRHEVHEAPSLVTIRRLDEYLKKVTNPNVKQMILTLRSQLESLFGAGDVNQFMQVYSLNPQQKALFTEYLAAVKELTDATSAGKAAQLLSGGTVISTLDKLAKEVSLVSALIRKGGFGCAYDNVINCNFEHIDYLSQLQKAVFSLSNQFVGRLREHGVDISYKDFLTVSLSLVQTSRALGLANSSLEDLVASELSKSGSQSRDSLTQFLANFETGIQGLISNYRGQFLPYITKYKLFSDSADMFVDDTLRGTPVLPLANLASTFKNSLLAKSGVSFFLRNQSLQATFQVINPGIARGKLYVPKIEDVMKPDFRWNANGIYLLEKTPGTLQKIAGIMTTDSGSLLSHVQLLASNHGLPNVFVSPSLLQKIATLAGQEILIVALPNGEAQIKLWSEATQEEIAVYNEYYKVKENKRVRLTVPADLDKFNYPVQLSQLRMKHAGHIAGGKATGQAEVSSIPSLKQYVPKGLVLPFGVYFEHIKENGIYDLIKNTFSSPQFRGDTDEAHEFRKNALAKIQTKIKQIELKPAVKSFIMAALLDFPYRDAAGRRNGVFVRSDTNAEDLPGFVGAGLNLTVGNVRNIEDVFQAIKTVWASPFEERAFTWRNDLLENPWDILPSVVIQLGMPADKAGVMIVGSPTQTDDVDDSVYIAANEGLGFTTVGGEFSAEEILISRKNNYDYKRLKKSFAPTRYVFRDDSDPAEPNAEKKFLKSVPVKGLDPIVTEAEAKELARVGDTIQKHIARKYKNLGKWDLEWCIVNGKVIIVQLRAFNGNKIARDVSSLGKLQKARVINNFNVLMDDRVFSLSDK